MENMKFIINDYHIIINITINGRFMSIKFKVSKFKNVLLIFCGIIFSTSIYAFDVTDCPPAFMLKQTPLNNPRHIPESGYWVFSNQDIIYKGKKFYIMVSPVYAQNDGEALHIAQAFIKTISEPKVSIAAYCYYDATKLPEYYFIPGVRLWERK